MSQVKTKFKMDLEGLTEADLKNPLPPLMFGYSLVVINGEKNKVVDFQVLIEGIKFSPITISCPNNESFIQSIAFVENLIQGQLLKPEEILEEWKSNVIKMKLQSIGQNFKQYSELEIQIQRVLNKIKSKQIKIEG